MHLFLLFLLVDLACSEFTIYEDFENLNITSESFYWGGDPPVSQYQCGSNNLTIFSRYLFEVCADEGLNYVRRHPSNLTFHNTSFIGFQLNNYLPATQTPRGTLLNYNFIDDAFLSDFINISFDGYHVAGAPAFLYLDLKLLNLSNNKAVTLPVELLNDNATSGACSLYHMKNKELVNGSFLHHVITSSTINPFCLIDPRTQNYKLLEFSLRYNRNSENPETTKIQLYFDNLKVNVKTNELPHYNVTIAQDVCLSSSLESGRNISLTVNANDPEGDVIYYSLKANEENFMTTYSYDDSYIRKGACTYGLEGLLMNFFSQYFLSHSIECNDMVDVTMPEAQFIDIGSCNVNFDSINNSDFYIDVFPNNVDSLRYMLVYNPNCQKEPETYLKTDFAMKDLVYSANFYLMKYAQNSFNLSFYNNPYENDYVLKFRVFTEDNNNVSFFVVNGSQETRMLDINTELSKVGLTNYLGMDVRYDSTLNTFNLSVGIKNGSISTYQGSNPKENTGKLIKAIGVRIRPEEANYLYSEIFSYGGYVLSPAWNTTIPSRLNIVKEGLNTLNFYVTDSSHKERDIYNFTTISFIARVTESCLPLNAGIGSTDPDSITENKDMLGFLKYMVGLPFKEFLQEVGEYENGKTLIYWVWFVSVLITFVLEYFITSKMDFTVPLFLPSLVFFFISWSIDYFANMIVFGFLMALPLSGVLAGMWLGGHHAK